MLAIEHQTVDLPDNDVAVDADRRAHTRTRTVYRTSRVVVGGREGMARIHNVSDEGLMLSTTMLIDLNDRIRVDLSDVQSVTGTVVWTDGRRCGVKLDQPCDSVGVLRQLAVQQRAGITRPARIRADTAAVATSEIGIRPVRVHDVSQRGMKISYHRGFRPGLGIKISLPSGVERRGIVRWTNERVAGVELMESFTAEELGRTELL